jgi:hypothetical protein
VQGSSIAAKDGPRVAIIEHEDVRRMLLSMKAQIEAARLLTYESAKMMDRARTGDGAAQARMDLLVPIVKAWCTDMAVEVASTGLQIHGGMGFIEEMGAAQFYRDARILPIYEGANGIHGIDLAFRKVLMNGGAAAKAWFDETDRTIAQLAARPDMKDLHDNMKQALANLRHATDHLLKQGQAPQNVAAVATPYLRAFGVIAGGAMMARAALVADDWAAAGGDAHYCDVKKRTAAFYAVQILPQAEGSLRAVMGGSKAVVNFGPNLF